MAVRLGINPIGWSNDDLRELGGATPLETCLAETKLAGYDGIELGHKFPRDAATLRPIMARHDLALVSGWYSTELLARDAEAEIEAMQPHLTLLKAMGCGVLIAAECSNTVHGTQGIALADRPVLAPGGWAEFGRRLTVVADAVAAAGLELVYHHHMGTVVQTGDEIDSLMAACGPSVRLLLDTGHATFGGVDPVALARRYRARIGHVHCKDIRKDIMARVWAERMSFLDGVVAGVFTVPGDGMVDFPAVLAELPGYDRWLVVEAEQDPEKANPLTYARMGRDNLARYARGAGMM
jgi:inosose dehydratase/3D-(3,5/4)-trihydroxycyclohexane-1,2-dione acylhydrolase (decyclizing)